MKNTLTTNQVADALYDDKNAGWTYAGAKALAEYLEELEDDMGEEMELDVVAVRCEFTEYESATEAAADYVDKDEPFEGETEEDLEKASLEYLQERTQVVEFDGGIIIQQF